MLDKISFILGEAMIAMRRNGFMTFAAISTVAVSLFLLGGAAYVYQRATRFAEEIPGKFDMRVFLRDGTDSAGIEKTATDIRAIEGVDKVFWLPRDKMWEIERAKNPKLTEGLDNPYPDGFKVLVKKLELADEIAAEIRKLPTVIPTDDGVQYMKDEQAMVDNGIKTLRWLGPGIGGLLLFTAGILIFNAIRLAVLSRKLEIRIMRLVGASPITVFLPFVIEGLLQGVIGGCISSGLLFLANRQFADFVGSMNSEAVVPDFPVVPSMLLLGALGGLFGVFCSTLSLKTRYDTR